MTNTRQVARQVEVHFTPPPPELLAGTTCLVIDTLRATTVITTLIAGDASAVYPVATLDAARQLAQDLDAKLVGERGGLPAEGFDYGNSPAEFARLDVRGWTLVQSTSNGSQALERTAEAECVLVACLRNRLAAAQAALATSNDLAIVCSGDGGGSRPSVEDVYTAGALVAQLVTLEPALELAAGARLALRIHDSYATAADAFADAPHADNLRRLGLQADLDFAADLDVESAVPVVARDRQGRLRIIGS
jgi:2-phosphosulfolactate phosphatase